MKGLFFFGFLSAMALVLFLVLRPVVAASGTPAVPDTAGRAKKLLPEERADRVTPEMPVAEGPKPVAGAPLEAIEQQIVTLTNEVRRSAGLPPVVVEPSLRRTARSHGQDMIERAFVDHINPDGLTAEDRVSRDDRRIIGMVGETIGSASTKDAEMARRIVGEWIGNPGDRESILRPDYTQIGVGVVPSGTDVRAVQVFARTVARTETAIPASVVKGDTMHVAVADPAVSCDAVDVFSPATGLAVIGPMPFGDLTMDVPPGIYKLRFRCSGGGMRKIYAGPRFEVTP